MIIEFTELNLQGSRLDQLNLMQIIFSVEFPTQPRPGLTCRVLCFTPSIKRKNLATF